MIKIELEERIDRRDYKLPSRIGCIECENNDDPNFDFVNLIVEREGIFQKCMNGHKNKVHRRCTKCETNIPFTLDTCVTCEERIYETLLQEKIIEAQREAIRAVKRMLRNKEITKDEYDDNTKGFEVAIKEAEKKLNEIKNPKKVLLAGVLITQQELSKG